MPAYASSGYYGSLIAPADHAFVITPSDTEDFSRTTRGIYVGTFGDLTIVTAKGETVTLVGIAAGVIHPIQARRINSTNTTADNIVGFY